MKRQSRFALYFGLPFSFRGCADLSTSRQLEQGRFLTEALHLNNELHSRSLNEARGTPEAREEVHLRLLLLRVPRAGARRDHAEVWTGEGGGARPAEGA